jgi:hypothetical protein
MHALPTATAQRLNVARWAVWLVQRLLQDFYEGMELEGSVEAVYFFHGVKVDIGGQFDGCAPPSGRKAKRSAAAPNCWLPADRCGVCCPAR